MGRGQIFVEAWNIEVADTTHFKQNGSEIKN